MYLRNQNTKSSVAYAMLKLAEPLGLALLLALVLSLAACQDSSQNTGSNTFGLNSNGSNSNQNVNGSPQGWIWHSRDGYRVDVSTGERDWLHYYMYPRADGREYAHFSTKYKTYDVDSCYFPVTTSAIVIRDSVSLQTTDFMEVHLRISGPVLLSPDGQTLAAWASPNNECANNYYSTYLVILDRSGNTLVFGNGSVQNFDWMPDNRLAFMLEKDGQYKLVIENERNTLFGNVVNLPPLPGSPARFRISPDGKQVLFEVVSRYPTALTTFSFREATIWIMDIDGSNLRKLADTSRQPTYGIPRVNQPVWSPDAQNVLMTENYKSGFTPVTGVDSTSLTLESTELATVNYDYMTYIVPANSELTLLPPESFSPTGVRPLFWTNEQGYVQPVQMDPMPRQHWTPKVQ